MKKLNTLILALVIATVASAQVTLTTVSPSTAVKGSGSVVVTVAGSGFSTSANYNVILTNSNFNTIVGTSAGASSTTSLHFTVAITSTVDTGWYILSVDDGTGAGGFATKANAFKVTPAAVVHAGIAEASNNAISLYPNPVRAKLYIQSEQPMSEIALTSLSGQVVLSQASNNDKEVIDVQGLATGMYILSVADRTGAISYRRVVVE